MTTSHDPTTPPTQSQPRTSQQQQPQLPPPQTFTFLPQLHTLLTHLGPLQPSPNTTRPRSPTLTRNKPDSSTTGPGASVAMARTASALSTRSRDESLEPKDLPALVYPVRQQIERAKEMVRGLPDGGRGVEEQEREIQVLEAKVKGLEGRLGWVRSLAGRGVGEKQGGDGDVVMEGVEG